MTTNLTPQPSSSYLGLIRAGEPYRLLFPLGLIFGLIGILLWPAFVWKAFAPYPGLMHARVMVECFMSAFVIGFLGTALPRLLDVPRLGATTTFLFAIALLVICSLHLGQLHTSGDIFYLFTLIAFVLVVAIRFIQRRDTPPPGFILVALGIASALTGTILLLLTQIPLLSFPMAVYTMGRLLLYQGFILLPIMGVGAFLLPRFFELPNRQNFHESLTLSTEWKARAAFAGLCGFLVLLSFLLEALGFPSVGYALRAGAVLLYFWREVPVHRARFGGGSLVFALRIALFSIPIGYLAMAMLPAHQTSLIHIVFITGFSLLVFTVASRVILGHSGQSALFKKSLWSIRILITLMVLAMATRVSADWMPDIRLTHYGYAALAWAIGAIIWAIYILPAVRQPDE